MFRRTRIPPLILSAALAAVPLHAQERPAPRDTAVDTTLAVTVVGRDELRDAPGSRVDQALQAVPGVLAPNSAPSADSA